MVYHLSMMTKRRAQAEAEKRWGGDAHVRHAPRAMAEAHKAPLLERLKLLRSEGRRETVTERNELVECILTYRCVVGYVSGGFYSVRGSGDTWEEAFAKADKADGR